MATLSVAEERELAEILWEICSAPREDRRKILQDVIARRAGRESDTARRETLAREDTLVAV